ncbi:hypothetical protein [Exilibacterium tricleocarpae]|uniref:hypothetical protein n=1 Tax=Exilibacterium tricleocarpae TaxID=2591008 RepID=UPI0015D227B7|nr:hypothetical protein [Exilibacterium tricleocarpae]
MSNADNGLKLWRLPLIRNNHALVDLNSLQNPTTIGGFLSVRDNFSLENISGLSQLTRVPGKTEVLSNTKLASDADSAI